MEEKLTFHEQSFVKMHERKMGGGGKRLWYVSPTVFCIFAAIVAIAARLILKDFYIQFIREPFIFSQSLLAVVFYLVCIMCLYLGIKLGSVFFKSNGPLNFCFQTNGNTVVLMILVLALCIMVNFYSLSIILSNSFGLFDMLLRGEGSAVKTSIDTSGALTQAQPMLIAVLTWFLFRFQQVRRHVRPFIRRLLKSLLLFGLVTSVSISTAKLARFEIMPLIVQLFIVFSAFALVKDKNAMTRFFIRSFAALVVVILIFMFFSFLRDSDGTSSPIRSLLGYSVASFNRLEALLDGSLRYTYAGTGVYGMRFFSHIPLLHNVVDVGTLFGMPDGDVAWRQEFADVGSAGLDPSLIWATAPGYMYADFGFFCFPMIFFIGGLWQIAWRNFVLGRTVGVVMYPFMATCIALWFSANFIAFPALITYLFSAIILSLLERVFCQQKRFQKTVATDHLDGYEMVLK